MFQRKIVTVMMALSVFAFGAWAQNLQQPPHTKMQPHTTPPLNPVDQEQFVGYWTAETGWNSELQLRNNQIEHDLTVTPALRLADGAETTLPPVTIKPQEVKSIDLDAAIAAAPAPQLVGSYGSVVLRYRSPSAASLYTAMMIRRTGHAVAFHIDAIGESQEFQIGGREGIWWLPNDTASDYLILANQGGNAIPLDLSLYDASGKMSTQKILLGARETTRYSVRKLVQAGHLTGSYGGITISTASHAGSLITLHFLFDEKAAFAAILKMFDHQDSKLEERDYAKTGMWTLRAPMLALSNPDPALAFPPGTTLHPELFVRNTTGKPIDAALRFNWRTANSTGKAPGPAVRLAPYETRRIDVAALQNGTLPKEANWTSVTITTNSKPDELMAVAASYDETLRYGAQTPFSDQLTFRWEGGMWEYDPYHDSIITAGNGGTKPTHAAFTIFYNQGTQRYDLEQTLQPDEQMWIDVGKLIREHVPDKSGKTLPSDLTMGSYEFRDLTNTGVGTLFEGKVIYDKTYGHVAYGCAACCGYLNPSPQYNPIGVPFGGPADQGVNAPDMCSGGTIMDVSDSFYNAWSVYDTATATVDYYGTHTGQSIGSTTSQTSGLLNNNDWRLLCPARRFTPGGGVNVNPTVTFGNTPLVPIQKPVPTTATVNPSTNTTPITLSIRTLSGTGSATFPNGSTLTITTTTSVTLVGQTASSTPNNMELDAQVGTRIVGSMLFTVTAPIDGAIPVNYRQTAFSVRPSAVLHFEYMWDSSSGNLADLSSCQVEEYVTYVGPNPYSFRSPPYVADTPIYWPYKGYTPVSGTTGTPGIQDDHGHWSLNSAQQPYVVEDTASSDQVYQFTCTNYQPNVWTQLMPISGQIPITRLVRSTNGAPPWTYDITKYSNNYPYETRMTLP